MIYAITLIVLQACDPAWAALFTPIRPVLGRYDVCTVPDPIEAVVMPGWTVEPADPLDAFGASGSYDRSKLARLYGATRPRVARGWAQRDHEFTSTTLISPYPDVTLSRLQSGTLVIRWILPSTDAGDTRRPPARANPEPGPARPGAFRRPAVATR